ncbi:hypothetical protein DH2020_041607 [Rehmannia glutinosa]|uniref:Large ribosomal subunit protein eL14 domain-containing protein n=1 Tax=Rehmannia glutinosa TaxID=99300 RepID=A0ABR0UQU1_REHGL
MVSHPRTKTHLLIAAKHAVQEVRGDREGGLVNSARTMPSLLSSLTSSTRIGLSWMPLTWVPLKKTLIDAMEAADVKGKWEKSSWGRKLIVQKRRASLNDFDRFKLMLAKIKRAGFVRQELAKLKKESAA